MDTEALRLFVLAAEKLNISAAGRVMGLAPSMASARLSKLEKTIGADLMHRSTRKVALSAEGREFLPYARDMLASEEAARAALGQTTSKATGTLRFTAPSTFSSLYIAPILPKFMAQNPDLTLDLQLSDKQFGLIEGSFDLALRNAALRDSSLRGRKLADDTRVLCAAPEYLKQYGTPEVPEDLPDHKVIGFANARPHNLVSHDGATSVFSPERATCRLIIDDGTSHKEATVAGGGISANSLWSVYQELQSGTLVRVLPEWTLADETVLWLMYPQANVLSAKVRVFMDFLVQCIGKKPPWL